MTRRPNWDALPLFADDMAIGTALLGPTRAGEFHGLATLAEGTGFPKIDAAWGGRYVPAIKAYFDLRYGLTETRPRNPGGTGDASVWQTNRRRSA